jgi:calcineurin-like phosphoesterase family protein
MSKVRFIADLHLGHKNMATHRGFKDELEHDEHIISMWNSIVHKRDLTYILGDVTMETSKWYFRLDELSGRKIVVLGNHDMPKDIPELLKHVDKVAGMIQYKGIFLTHAPIHPMELDYRVSRNIHGHIHEKVVTREKWESGKPIVQVPHEKYHCVSCEQVNYTPKTLEELGITR